MQAFKVRRGDLSLGSMPKRLRPYSATERSVPTPAQAGVPRGPTRKARMAARWVWSGLLLSGVKSCRKNLKINGKFARLVI